MDRISIPRPSRSNARDVAEIAARRLASPPIHLVIEDEPTGWERAEREAARF